MPTAKELKEYLIHLIADNKGKAAYGKNEIVNLINVAYTDLLEREAENAKC